MSAMLARLQRQVAKVKRRYVEIPPTVTTIMAQNLPSYLNVPALRKQFEQYGNVLDMRIKHPPQRQVRKPPVAYVTFKDHSGARRLLEAHEFFPMFVAQLDGKNRRPLSLSPCLPTQATGTNAMEIRTALSDIPKTEQRPRDTIYVGNLDFNTRVAELTAYFRQWGKVLKVVLVKDKLGQFKGVAFVRFQDVQDAVKCWEDEDRAPLRKRVPLVQFKQPTNTIDVTGLNPETRRAEIWRYFAKWGEVRNVTLRTGEDGKPTGANVVFAEAADAVKCWDASSKPPLRDVIPNVRPSN
ncbi:RNA-binding domain-containing protein [Hymenopellis radicata]|nr:RNA-binding domain-containing protein [Hymenopellis radicata]